MLTKKERATIAKRLDKCDLISINTLYNAIIGEQVPDIATYEEDIEAVFRSLMSLCDTSNMIELPLDNNDEIIHIGDAMCDGFDRKVIVSSIEYKENERNVFVKAYDTKADVTITYLPERLIHKNISKHKQLAERLDTIAATDLNNKDVAKQLSDIADELRNLDCGDKDD